MRIVNCLHPKIVFSPYLNKDISVPCGKCDSCLANRAATWVQRLECERLHSAYTVFFTLTYSDEYLPSLTIGWQKSSFLPDKLVHVKRDFSNLHLKKQLSDEYNNFEISVTDSILSEQSTQNIMRLHACNIPYCSVYDAQNFLKRLRSKLYRKAYGIDKGLEEKQKIRYFLVSELGPTTLRPHYHGILFFDDSKLQTYLSDIFLEAWPFGRTDLKYVQSTATSYVAQYVNCFSHLPRIYRETALRPFCLCSRQTPIGLRSIEESTIKELFYSSSCLVPIQNQARTDFSYVPFWRCLENRLYPKLPANYSLNNSVRFDILRASSHFDTSNFQGFISDLSLTYSALCANAHKSNLVNYLITLCPYVIDKKDYIEINYLFSQNESIKRFYYVVRRIQILMYRFNVSLRRYLDIYNTYFSNKELYKLQEYYTYQENFTRSTDSRLLLNLDNCYFSRLRSISWNSLTPTMLLQLYGFGFTYSELKEIFSDVQKQKSYFRQLHYSHTMDYVEMKFLKQKIVSDSRKVRRKNEYLEQHPEFKLLY